MSVALQGGLFSFSVFIFVYPAPENRIRSSISTFTSYPGDGKYNSCGIMELLCSGFFDHRASGGGSTGVDRTDKNSTGSVSINFTPDGPSSYGISLRYVCGTTRLAGYAFTNLAGCVLVAAAGGGSDSRKQTDDSCYSTT